MKHIVLLGVFLCSVSLTAQSEEEAVKSVVESFFDGFHAQDSTKMKHWVSDRITMQTIGNTAEGDTILRDVDFSRFLKGIVSIPDSIPFREEITRFSIQVDGPMAHAWTDYRF